MNIAAVVIIYHPEKHHLENVEQLRTKVGQVYLVDNTERSAVSFDYRSLDLKNIEYLHDRENKGIAQRLNEVCTLANKKGYDWLLTMDQDSLFDDVMLNNYFNCIEDYKGKDHVSMFGVAFTKEVYKEGMCSPISLNHLITSGSMVNLSLVEKVGGFDENLFIDEVDFEYCLRSVYKGYQIIQFTNIFLHHQLGMTGFHPSIKNLKKTERVLHSPTRIYYMTRNFFYVKSRYKKIFADEIKIREKILWNRLKNNILYNPKRIEVLKYVIEGIRHYKKNRMGKLK